MPRVCKRYNMAAKEILEINFGELYVYFISSDIKLSSVKIYGPYERLGEVLYPDI